MTYESGHFVEIDTKALQESGEFVGYASTFNNVDSGNDVVMPGAFTKTLKRRPATQVKLLLQHDTSEPVGVIQSLEEDPKGLKVNGRLILQTTKGRETYELMKAGALDKFSIGYKTLKDRFDRIKGVRFLEELDLFEISIVTFAMNMSATLSNIKGNDPAHARALVSAISKITQGLKK